MRRSNILLKGLLVAALSLGTATLQAAGTHDDNQGTKQEVTIDGETVNRTVSEIRIDGNNAVLVFTDGGTLAVDMQHVSMNLSYDEATGLSRLFVDDGSVKVYDLKGHRVDERSTRSGVYIVNGKKIAVKNK